MAGRNLLEGRKKAPIPDLPRNLFESPEFADRAAKMNPIDLSIARSKDDAFGRWLRAQAKKPIEGETKEARFKRLYGSATAAPVGAGEGIVRSYLQGGTFGGGDEAVAAAAAFLNKATNKDPGRSLGELYDAYHAREAGKVDQFRREHLGKALTTEMAGAIPTSLLLPWVRAGAASTGGKVLGTSLTGGYQGGLYGLLSAKPGERQKGGLYGTGIGGGLGALSVPLANAAKGIWSRLVGTSKAAKDVGLSPQAHGIMRNVMSADDATETGVKRILQGGPDAMVADSGPNAQTLLDVAVSRIGPGATKAKQAIENRAARGGQRLTKMMDTVLGKPQGVRAQARNVAASTRSARDTAYYSAYRTPVDYSAPEGRAIEEVLERIPVDILNKAIKEANDIMRASIDPAIRKTRQIIAKVSDDGNVVFSEKPNVLQLDHIKRALGEIAAEAVDTFGRLKPAGARIGNLAKDLRDAIGNAAPTYLKALEVSADKIERDQAIKLGQNLFKKSYTREMVKEEVMGMTPAARGELLKSVRSYIDEQVANVNRALTDSNMDAREAANVVKSLSSRAAREKLTLAVGSEKKAVPLLNELKRTGQSLSVRANVAQNSKTFVREATDNLIKQRSLSGITDALRGGQVFESAKRVVQILTGRTAADTERITQRVYAELADALTGPRNREAVAFINNLEDAAKRLGPKEEALQTLVRRLVAKSTAVAQPSLQTLDVYN
jgi:hypothetical protein